MICINYILITAYLLLKARASYTIMIDRFNCSSYLQNKTVNPDDLCFMLTKCQEHINRYQTDFVGAKKYISCCQTYAQLQSKLHCKLNCTITCEKETKCTYEQAQCLCHDGYTFSETEQRCLPKCPSTCPTNKCTAPNVCECPHGYKLGDSGDHCLPECSDECVNNNGYCPIPNRCKCLPGYKSIKFDNSKKCIPECFTTCESSSGTCHLPNICQCPFDHYFNKSTKMCQPDCTRSCLNSGGTCTKSNVCTCSNDYMYDKNIDACMPNHQCDVDYEFNITLQECVQKCPGDYYYSSRLRMCKPKCDSCQNGLCLRPNQCRCRRGYTLNTNTGECVPKCPEHYQIIDDNKCQAPTCLNICKNGYCISQNRCECLPGYTMISTNVCEWLNANCSTSNKCVNGLCLSNNTCLCNDDFINDANDSMICIPMYYNKALLGIHQNGTMNSFIFANPVGSTVYKFPWIIIFCTAALISAVLLVGAETWVHRVCTRTINDRNKNVEYKWLENNNLFIPTAERQRIIIS